MKLSSTTKKNIINIINIISLVSIIVIFFTTILVIYISLKNMYIREGFKWNEDTIISFIDIQNTMNPNVIFDVKKLQEYVSQSEVMNFLKKGEWLWSKKTQNIYKKFLEKNPYVRLYPELGVNNARTIYNEKSILYILKGQYENEEKNKMKMKKWKNILPSGWGNFGYTSGLIK